MTDRKEVSRLNNPFVIVALSVLATIAIMLAFTPLPKNNESEANQIINIEQSDNGNQKTRAEDNRNIHSHTMSVESIRDSIGNAEPNNQYYKDGGNKIDCDKATTFSDLVACKSLDAQNSIDGSTVGIFIATVASAIFAALAFVAGILSVSLLWKSNKIAVKSSRMSSMAVCDIFVSAPVVFSNDGIDETNVMFNYEIINSGSSPAIDVSINFKVIGIDEAREKTFPSRDFKGFYGELFKGKPPTLRGIIYPTAIPSEEITVPSSVSEGKRPNPFNNTLSSSLNTEIYKGDICIATQILYHSLSYSDFTITACKTFKLIPINEARTQFLLKVVPDLSWLDDGAKGATEQ